MLTKLVLRIDENQTALSSNLRTTLEECERVFFQQLVFLRSCQSLGKDFFLRDVFVVCTDFSLGCRRDDGRRELLVFLHTLRQTNAADFTDTTLVSTPCTTAKIAAHNHFYGESLAKQTYCNHGIGRSELPVGANVGGSVEELGSNLVEHLTLVRNAFGQNYVESRNAVSSYHHQAVAEVINIAYLTMINTLLTGEIEISLS